MLLGKIYLIKIGRGKIIGLDFPKCKFGLKYTYIFFFFIVFRFNKDTTNLQLLPNLVYFLKLFFFLSGPEVVSNIAAIGSTTNMAVSWTPAVGQVDSYSVLLYRNYSLTVQLVAPKTNLSNTTVDTVFQGLTPGVLYCVVVVSKSGPFENNSSRVCNATCELQ